MATGAAESKQRESPHGRRTQPASSQQPAASCPVVLIPGIQGRWEWMRPAVDALTARTRVVTFSLCGEPGTDAPFGDDAMFDANVEQVERELDRAGVRRAVICGVSYGGLVALRFAATHADRTAGLVLVSTPPARWELDQIQRGYVERPVWSAPAFIARSPRRLWPEIRRAFGSFGRAAWFGLRYLVRVIAAPMSPSRMARRVRAAHSTDFTADCARVMAPTLVITGEEGLDRVVPVAGTRRYLEVIRDAHCVTLENTGHIGLVTRPERFAEIVAEFAETVR
jgi:3-oxoadipate enol-lactonase